MSLKLCQPPTIVGENGHIPMTDGASHWIVIVTQEALESIASPPDASLGRLMRFAHVYAQIANNKLTVGRDSDRNRLWVMEEDVAVWLASEQLRLNSRRRDYVTGSLGKRRRAGNEAGELGPRENI